MSEPDPATSGRDRDIGSVFVANYPPFSFWSPAAVEAVEEALDQPPLPGTPLGLYLHVPFCRKRCKFCYFRVYTGKNAEEVGRYLEALGCEAELYSRREAVFGRHLRFVYLGGGTPSFLSERQLSALVERVRAAIPWQGAQEVTFECEPGTLSRPKLEAIRALGVTRLSLGIESFDDEILAANGRAHGSREIRQIWPAIRGVGFPQVNVDLIAGMVGESWRSWRATVRETLRLAPDSVTVYPLELPHNTRFTQELAAGSLPLPIATWTEKRAWHGWAIEEMARAGYCLSSAYTMVRDADCSFVYRDQVWEGCDLLGLGVASFSHLCGVHFQNAATWAGYLEAVEGGRLPLARALVTTPRERLVRELVLQLKRGRLDGAYFRRKFGIVLAEEFAAPLAALAGRGLAEVAGEEVRLTPAGLLRVDSLLPAFYDPRYRDARYS